MIRIGTRKSALAIWQATQVKKHLEKLGETCILVPIESRGDQDLIQPLYAMGIQGIFTKSLDSALLSQTIDIAVHSLKDVPTKLPEGIKISACLKRGPAHDVVVYHPDFFDWNQNTVIGTGSLRRKAQWLRKYPQHNTENLRGNLQKRLEKLNASSWGGAIFAQAGLVRMDLLKENFSLLDWMNPAPAQGIIGVASLKKDTALSNVVQQLNCEETSLCAEVERTFLNTLEGGCTAPIGAYAFIKEQKLHFQGGLFSLDGKKAIEYQTETSLEQGPAIGKEAALHILENGGAQLMQQIKSQLK